MAPAQNPLKESCAHFPCLLNKIPPKRNASYLTAVNKPASGKRNFFFGGGGVERWWKLQWNFGQEEKCDRFLANGDKGAISFIFVSERRVLSVDELWLFFIWEVVQCRNLMGGEDCWPFSLSLCPDRGLAQTQMSRGGWRVRPEVCLEGWENSPMDLRWGLVRYGCSPGFIKKNIAHLLRHACWPAAALLTVWNNRQ